MSKKWCPKSIRSCPKSNVARRGNIFRSSTRLPSVRRWISYLKSGTIRGISSLHKHLWHIAVMILKAVLDERYSCILRSGLVETWCLTSGTMIWTIKKPHPILLYFTLRRRSLKRKIKTSSPPLPSEHSKKLASASNDGAEAFAPADDHPSSSREQSASAGEESAVSVQIKQRSRASNMKPVMRELNQSSPRQVTKIIFRLTPLSHSLSGMCWRFLTRCRKERGTIDVPSKAGCV